MNNNSGLLVIGTINDRRKREIVVDRKKIEIISYDIIDDDNRTYYIDAYSPDTIYDRGEKVQIPIYIKPFIKKDGKPSYTLNIRSDAFPNRRGESF